MLLQALKNESCSWIYWAVLGKVCAQVFETHFDFFELNTISFYQNLCQGPGAINFWCLLAFIHLSPTWSKMSSSKTQYHIPYYFGPQLRPGYRSFFLSQLASGTVPLETLNRNQQELDITSYDLPLPHRWKLSEDLEINNTLRHIVSFNVVTQTWVDWQR